MRGQECRSEGQLGWSSGLHAGRRRGPVSGRRGKGDGDGRVGARPRRSVGAAERGARVGSRGESKGKESQRASRARRGLEEEAAEKGPGRDVGEGFEEGQG